MVNSEDFINALSNLEIGWTNQWSFMDQRDKLLKQKKFAQKNKAKLKKEGYDVDDIYKQLEEFDECVRRQIPITDDEEEKIILAALEYAKNNRPIISSIINENLSQLYHDVGDTNSPKKAEFRYKFDVYRNLIDFYLCYKEDFDLFEEITNFLKFGQKVRNFDSKHPENYYYTYEAICYLKFLIKKKEFSRANYIIDNFDLTPIGKGDINAFEKIKEKIYKEKNK